MMSDQKRRFSGVVLAVTLVALVVAANHCSRNVTVADVCHMLGADTSATGPERFHVPRGAAIGDPTRNVVPREELAPRLLNDEVAMEAYLEAFPNDEYRLYEVAGIGRFWIDDLRSVIKDDLRAGEVWEPQVLRRMIEHVRPGTTVIDVGAHIGVHAIPLSRLVGPNGRVYAFEPQKKVWRELVQNARANGADNLIALRYAVGDEAGIIEMNAPRDGREGQVRVGGGGDRAELRRLDDFSFENVSLIKIDVEGHEDYVLAGAVETIQRNRPVMIVETEGNFDTEKPAGRARTIRTIQTMESFGYHVTRIGSLDWLAIPDLSHDLR